MTVERKLVLTKLVGFLTGEISQTEIYEWALFVVVSSDYETIAKNDRLTEQIFQFLIDIDKVRETPAPTKKVLEYFIQCLENQREFTAQDYRALIDDKPGASAVSVPVPVKPPAQLGWLVNMARIYVLIFLMGSIFLNAVSILKPNFLVKPDEIAPTAAEVGKDASPHLIYGILILLALSFKMPRFALYAFIPVAIWGMFFYWSAATSFAVKNGLAFLNVLLLMVAVVVPPTAAFFILLIQWLTPTNKDNMVKAEIP